MHISSDTFFCSLLQRVIDETDSTIDEKANEVKVRVLFSILSNRFILL